MIASRRIAGEIRIEQDQTPDKADAAAYLDDLRNDHLGLVGGSPAMVALRDLIRRVASSERPVLISGPSGAGKSLVADAIHRLAGGRRREGRLLVVNCAELGEKDLDQVLFGVVRRPGSSEMPEGETLVLEEVDALPPTLQSKMVRALQAGGLRLGPPTPRGRAAVRVLATTSQALALSVRERRFRADLLYELGVLTVTVPGLEEHRADIPALIHHFLRLRSNAMRVSPEAVDLLAGPGWSGSVRDLKNLLDRVDASNPVLEADDLRALLSTESGPIGVEDSLTSLAGRLLHLPIGNKLAAVEEALLVTAMEVSEGNKSAAARLLGLHRKAVERKLEKYRVRYSAVAAPAGSRVVVSEVAPRTAPGRIRELLPAVLTLPS
jgi:DNA-binding NtrC family response regulator